MKYVLNQTEYDCLRNSTSQAYRDGLDDMWNIIKSQIDRYYFLNCETNNGVIVTLDAIKDQFNVNYNDYYHDPKIWH